MARFIFIASYMRTRENGKHLANLTKYIATREGVEKLPNEVAKLAPSHKQVELIEQLVKDFPHTREMLEYEDYLAAPTQGNASEFISLALEQNLDQAAKRENYVDYIANRPGVQRSGEHGLFDANGKVPNLAEAMRVVSQHNGVVWTPILSLRREDAERLGYTDVDNWSSLIRSNAEAIAQAYKIPQKDLRWYAALHDKDKHVHVHMLIYSQNPCKGYLTKQGLYDLRSAFAKDIFRNDMLHVYEQKSAYRDELQQAAGQKVQELLSEIESGEIRSPKMEELVMKLSSQLSCVSGKKAYGYLPPRVKSTVDAIVDELAKDERIAKAYSLWQEMQDEVYKTYSSKLPEHLPLSKQKEFKPVRNMVIREVLNMGVTEQRPQEEVHIPHEQAHEAASDAKASEPTAPPSIGNEQANQRQRDSSIPYGQVASTVTRMFHHMGRIFHENFAAGDTFHGVQIDRKRRRKLMEKRMAAGHKRDDHEDQKNNIGLVQM